MQIALSRFEIEDGKESKTKARILLDISLIYKFFTLQIYIVILWRQTFGRILGLNLPDNWALS